MAEATAKTLRIVWIGMLSMQLVYVCLGLSGVYHPAPMTGDGPPLFPIFAGAAAVLAILAVVLRGRLADSASNLPAGDPTAPFAQSRAAVIPWSLDGAIGVLGFVLMMFGHKPLLWLPFCAASFALLLLHAPRAAE